MLAELIIAPDKPQRERRSPPCLSSASWWSGAVSIDFLRKRRSAASIPLATVGRQRSSSLQAAETQTASGSILFIPLDTRYREAAQQGEVLAGMARHVTTPARAYPVDVKRRRQVLYLRNGGTEVQLPGEDYLIVSVRHPGHPLGWRD